MGVYLRGRIWYVDYYDSRGKRIREAVGSKKSDAIARQGKIMSAIRENRFFDIKKEYKHTFDELVTKYEDAFKKQTYYQIFSRFPIRPFPYQSLTQ